MTTEVTEQLTCPWRPGVKPKEKTTATTQYVVNPKKREERKKRKLIYLFWLQHADVVPSTILSLPGASREVASHQRVPLDW